MFELETPTKVTVKSVGVLNQKNKKTDENPGAKLTFEGSVSNDVLTSLEGHMKGALYMKANGSAPPDAQASLDGVEPISDMPVLTQLGRQCGEISWDADMTGYNLVMNLGIGTKGSNIDERDCEITEMKIKPQEGGAVRLKFSVTAPNLSDKQWMKLPRLKGREIDIALFAPSADTQGDIEGTDPKD
jgi:hypothetical protein